LRWGKIADTSLRAFLEQSFRTRRSGDVRACLPL
jgi:hypothetical protein